MNQPSKAEEANSRRLIALTYMEAVVSEDEDMQEMVRSSLTEQELNVALQALTRSLLIILANKKDRTPLDIITILRANSLNALTGNA